MQIKKYLIWFSIFLVISQTASAAYPTKDPLAEVITSGVSRSFEVSTQKLEFEKYQNQQSINYAALLPTLTLSSGRTWTKSDSLNSDYFIDTTDSAANTLALSARWTLWDNYRSIRTIQVGKVELQAQKIVSNQTIQKYIFDLISAYLNYELLRNQKEILDNQLAQSKWTNDESQALVKAGAKTKLDALDSEIDVANLERDLLEFNNQIQTAEKNIAVLLNNESITNLPRIDLLTLNPYYMNTFDKVYPEIVKNWKNRLVDNNLEIKIQKLRLDESLMELAQTKLSYFPQTSLVASHQYTLDSYVQEHPTGGRRVGLNETSVALQLSWQFWDWGSTPNTVENAKKSHEEKLIQYRQAVLSNEATIENLIRQFEVLKKTVQVSRLVVEKAATQLDYSKEVYKLGRITLLSMQQAVTRYKDAKLALASRLRDQNVLVAKLLYLTGYDLTPRGLNVSWSQ